MNGTSKWDVGLVARTWKFGSWFRACFRRTAGSGKSENGRGSLISFSRARGLRRDSSYVFPWCRSPFASGLAFVFPMSRAPRSFLLRRCLLPPRLRCDSFTFTFRSRSAPGGTGKCRRGSSLRHWRRADQIKARACQRRSAQ